MLQPAPKPVVEALVRRLVPGAEDGWTAAGVDEFLRSYHTPRGRAAFYAAARSIYLDAPNGDNGFWTRLQELEADALFVWGRRDRLVPIAFMRHVERTLDGAEHGARTAATCPSSRSRWRCTAGWQSSSRAGRSRARARALERGGLTAPGAVARMVGIVLGAGSSERLGRPKQTLPFGDTTLLGWTLRDAEASSLDRVVLVLGGAADEALAQLRPDRAEMAFNEAYGSGCVRRCLPAWMRRRLRRDDACCWATCRAWTPR